VIFRIANLLLAGKGAEQNQPRQSLTNIACSTEASAKNTNHMQSKGLKLLVLFYWLEKEPSYHFEPQVQLIGLISPCM